MNLAGYAHNDLVSSCLLGCNCKYKGINHLLGEPGLLFPTYGENIRNQQLPDDPKSLDKAMYYRFTVV